jgi:Tfp pilus assembly protein PilZ
MEKINGPERRKHNRLNANFVVNYRVKGFSSELYSSPFEFGKTTDVSQGGLLLTTDRKFDKGTHLTMVIELPFCPEGIEITGKVVNSEKEENAYKTHLMFKDSDEAFLKEIGDFVRNQLNG